MPAIVVGDHSDSAVAEFGFAGELGFGDVGHADDVEIHGAVHVGFGKSGKLRALHADVGAFAVDFDSTVNTGIGENARDLRAGRFVEADVSDQAAAEKRGDAIFGAVDKLVGDEKFAGGKFLFDRAYGADGDDAIDTEKL